MLQKLRSRHPIDLPTEGFGRRRPTVAILGGILFLFLLVPFLVSPLAAVYRGMVAGESVPHSALGIVVAWALLVVVLIVAGIRGKPGRR